VEFDQIENIPAPAQNPILFGHEGIAHFLGQMREEGRLHHALLFEGAQGIGKATLAFHLAWNILSDNAQGFNAPDISSSVWQKISRSVHPGLLHITRGFDPKTEKFRTAVTIEEIRRISRFLQQTVAGHGWRVVIIDAAEDMNRNAANALLKTLEEPPVRTVFVLVSHAAGRLLPTIRSRCQPLAFKPLSHDDMLRALPHIAGDVGFSADNPQSIDIITQAEGSVRQAILILLSGGLEIAAAVDTLVANAPLAVSEMYKLAAVLSGRDNEGQYIYFLDYLSLLVAQSAYQAAEDGDLPRAGALSAFWQDMRQDIVQAQAYNLDKKHFVLIILQKVHAIMHKRS